VPKFEAPKPTVGEYPAGDGVCAVGSAPGFINLYVGKECVEKNVPSADADARLIELIKEHGRWIEPVGAAART